MFAFAIMLALACGLAQAFQSPTNTELSRHVGNAEATLVSFTGGTLVLAVLVALFGQGDLSRVTDVPPWQLIGGLYGVIVVITITYAAPVLGIALTLTTLMLGQLVMGMVVDTFGLLGATAVPFNGLRLVGCLVIAAGILLVHIGKTGLHAGRANAASGGHAGRASAMLAISFAAGMGGAMQVSTNTTLSATVGTLEASLVSFFGGFLLILAFTLITTRGHLTPLGEAPKWSLTGGLYGGAGVLLTIIATPHLGVGIMVATMLAGQLIGGLAIDAFGLLRAPRVKPNGWRVAGIAAIVCGIALVALGLS